MLNPFALTHLVTDPFVKHQDAAALGVKLVDLETLMRRGNFISVHCSLTEMTRGMIGQWELSWMRPSAFLINAARGLIVN